ncbi:MATE family efflux transporter [Natronomonas sp. F2-12]|jgi:putative MATE family efflux protein|uniref:MATE family efflux transporter n=1 Tax=Natronomonas aquatica TaxID=2841590 RepID=A0A9R1CPD9_9EURY|nr:MATE family efflux transporter [Natronomonas aquatica]MCQ4332513.1 MATE family efflux transporter [Natronomonas aquatica]
MSRTTAPDRAVNVTDGALIRPLIVLSIPIVLTNLLQVGYNLADTFWVGRLGQPAVAALSFSWAIVFLIISLSLGFSVAGTVLVAQNKGAGRLERVSHVAGQTVSVVVGVSVLFSIVGFALAPTLLELVGATPGSKAYRLALEYTRTMFVGIPFVFGFFVFQSLLQGWGDTRTPLYLMTFGVALNVLLDPFFILGFQDNVVFAWTGLAGVETTLYGLTGFEGFGVQGAAFATILSRGIGAVIGIWLLLSGSVGIELSLSDFRPRFGTVRDLFRIGAPASIEISTSALSVTILTALVAIAGSDAVAAYGIGSRITSIVVLPALGVARGVETVVGQNLGAGYVDRARRGVIAAVGLIAGALSLFSVGIYLLADPIIGVFIDGTGAAIVTDIGGGYLRIVGSSYVFLGVFYVFQGGYRGSGNTRMAMVFAFVGFIVFRSVFAYALAVPGGLEATGIWYGEAIANLLMALLVGGYFLRGTWTGRVIDDSGSTPT